MLNVDNTCILWQGTDVDTHVFKNKILLECHVVKWYICGIWGHHFSVISSPWKEVTVYGSVLVFLVL